jgi:ATP-dependent helicase/nuclease subunit A
VGKLPAFLSQALALTGRGSIGARTVQHCASPLEMVMLAALRHPSGLDFAERIGVDIPDGVLPDMDLLERSQLSKPMGDRDGIPALTIRIMDPIHIKTTRETGNTESVDMETLRPVLDYQYPYNDLNHVPAKVSVSDLKGLRDMDEDAGLMLARQVNYDKPAFLQQGLSAAERGTATHKFMQFIPFDTTPLPVVRDRLVHRGTLSEQEGEAIDLRQIERFRQSPLAKRIAASPYVEREYRFLSQVPAERYDPSLVGHRENIMLQGVIDLFFEEDGGITLVDYKTDRSDDESYYVQKYALQLQLYADALEKLIEKPVKRRVIYAFSCQKEIDV